MFGVQFSDCLVCLRYCFARACGGRVIIYNAHNLCSLSPIHPLQREQGEIFLQNLKEYSPTITQLNPGLLLISASEVKRNDVADSNAADIATTNSNIYEGSAPAITPANSNNNNGGNDMNIWAVAAVAALGAMFIVIVTCTSILYCDWRKRKERRERRRERAFNMQMQQQQGGMMGAVYNSGGGSNYARSNDGKKNYTNMEIDGEAQQLQIVVPHASSGDTEEYDGISPSTQASNNNNTNIIHTNLPLIG